MLVSFCKANKIGFVMEGVDTPSQYSRYKREGVKLMTGRGVSKLSRWVTNEMLGQKEPEGEKREQYLKSCRRFSTQSKRRSKPSSKRCAGRR